MFSYVYVVCMNSADGQTTMTATIPDTITSWVLSAFAINPDVGLGVASERAEVIIVRMQLIWTPFPFTATFFYYLG